MNEPKTYFVRGIPQGMIEQLWKFAEPYVKRALDHTFGEVTADDLRRNCLNRDAQLWIISTADRVVGAATTEIVIYPQKKVCRVITLAGTEFDEWRARSLEIIKAWAIEQGCQGVEAYVRKGFVPKLRDHGFKHKYSVCHLDIEG